MTTARCRVGQELLQQLREWLVRGHGGLDLAGMYTRKVDGAIRGIFESAGRPANIVLLAVGGYGREELAPFSDVDIMFFATDRSDAGAAEPILYRLWDTGLEISHSFRTPRECIEEGFRDIRTRTTLLESRYVAGERSLYDLFMKKVYPEIAYRKQKEFVREKLKEMEKRHRDSGDSVFLLEPSIKEGEGGLRDIHTAYWLSRIALKVEKMSDFFLLSGPGDRRRFYGAYDFLLKTRFALHLESGRRNDTLSFEYQRNVADLLGFRDSKKFSAPERMLRYYYLKSTIVKDLADRVVARCSRQYVSVIRDWRIRKLTGEFSVSGGSLITTREGLFTTNPEKVMECYYLLSKTGKKFSESMKEKIRANLLRINRRTRNSPVAAHYFLEILKGERVYETLREMHEAGVLGRFIPEFGVLRHLVVYEPYHMFTVDEHSLHAMRNLEALRTTRYKNLQDLSGIVNGLGSLDALYMAILFHDIGKAAGRRHGEEGYKRLKKILERFNIEVNKRMRIEFLVRNHVLMSKIALTRETSDMEVIVKFADAVGDVENLKALYLVTYADMSAVNPGFLTTWKTYLLRELYEHTLDYLSGMREDRAAYLRCLQVSHPDIGIETLTDFVEEMPERYVLSTTMEKVIEDYRLAQRARESGLSMRVDASPGGFAELSMSAFDRPGLFSKIVGFLTSKGLNIVNGRIFTGKKGIVIDKISVSNWKDLWWEGFGAEIEEGLTGIIVGGKPVRVTRRDAKACGPCDIFIELDNEASGDFSVIEIFSRDRMGLLYDISTVMFELGIDIVTAMITTETGLAQDVFYVREGKNKINYLTVHELLSELWAILEK